MIMKRRSIITNNFIFNSELDMTNMVFRTPSIVDEFHFTESYSPEGHHNCIAVNDPLIMIFNQKRLESLGTTALQSWFNELRENVNSSVNQLLQHCSDSDLMAMAKPRCLQSCSDLKAWADYLSSNLDNFHSEYNKLMDERQKVKTDSVDTDSSQKLD